MGLCLEHVQTIHLIFSLRSLMNSVENCVTKLYKLENLRLLNTWFAGAPKILHILLIVDLIT
jgi:hypothetical protein